MSSMRDFMTQYTVLFTTVYVFVVMEISTATYRALQRNREPLARLGEDPDPRHRRVCVLLHDRWRLRQFGRRRDGFRCHLDRWLSDVMDIEGVSTPYYAPNANPHVERFHRTLREDALNHFIFLNARHVQHVTREFIEFYNHARPSQATHAIPDPYPELLERPRPEAS